MSEFLIRSAFLLALTALTGCSSLSWSEPEEQAMPVPYEPDPWVPLIPTGSPQWPAAPAPVGIRAVQDEGLATVVRELDAIARLVDVVSRMPAAPGEYRVNFARIQADIAAVRYGVVEALHRSGAPASAYPVLGQGYRE